MKKLHFLLFVAALSCFVMGCRKSVEVSFGIESKTIAAEGDTCTVELKSNGDWTISATEEWITVSPMSGNGDATLTFVVQPNPTEQERSQKITASTKDNTASITISQEGASNVEPNITINPRYMLGDAEGGSFQVTICTEQAWSIMALPEWITASAMEGEGDASVWLTIQPFLEDGRREADVNFGDENSFAQLHVVQTGTADPYHFLNIIPSEIRVACTGDTELLTLTCDEAWMAASDVDWIALDKMEGEGNDVVMLTVAPNPQTVARNAIVKFISASRLSALVTINQEASPDTHFLEVTPTSLNFGSESGSQDVTISCDVDWVVKVSESWLSLSTQEGMGDGSVTVTAANNVFNEPREALVTVVSGDLSRRVVITQEPGEVSFWASISPDTIYVAPAGGVKSFAITSNIDWVLSVPSWITMVDTSGSGDATMEMMVGSNNSYNSRIGYVKVVRNGVEMARMVVVQEGIPNILSTDVSELNFTAEGGRQYFHLTANQGWIIRNDEEWFVCDPMNGNGDMEVMVKVSPWTSSEPREATFIIKGDTGNTLRITVRQSN